MPAESDSKQSQYSLEQITELAQDLSGSIDKAISYITNVNEQTRMLSLNAQVEAARAGGQVGAAFAVVAQEIQKLSDRTSQVASEMREQTQGSIDEFNRVSNLMVGQIRGTRLTDLALNNIDLIDRNLYERTCDVRWWATDSALVEALSDLQPDKLEYAGQRMGVILSAYTVYYDLVLATPDGQVVANGRPDLYPSAGHDVSQTPWFKQAITSANGDCYGFESVHASPLVDQQKVLAYSCAVREDGRNQGRPLGVLGILFNWDDLAQVIVKRTPLPATEWPYSRVCIADDDGVLLADSQDEVLTGSLDSIAKSAYEEPRGFVEKRSSNSETMVAHVLAPGYETYTTGWHSVIIQTLPSKQTQVGTRAADSTQPSQQRAA